ncbi:MAG: oligosaccharide flippase family protein [Bacteroidia bacterium]|nr:oligosaccharide flippase family protein [Bacteroidia bacterium]MCZ2276960.1 oligosaccharide flippase family protein [Bacteroidia bacterium]
MFNLSFLKSEFSRNTLTLIAGTAIGQLIPVALQLFLRRIYTPEEFGALAVYLTLLGMITIVSALRYDSAIVLPEDDQTATNTFSLAVIFNLISFLLLLITMLFFRGWLAQLIGLPDKYEFYLFLLPFSCMAFGVYQAMNFWLIRKKAFKASAINKITRRASEGLVQVGSGISGIRSGLVWGDLAGNVANVASGYIQMLQCGFSRSLISFKAMKHAFWQFIEFPKYNALPTLLSSAATVLPYLFINKFYSTETVGYLDLTRLVLALPLVFISATVTQVFYQQITSRKAMHQSVLPEVRGILNILLLMIAVEMTIVLLFGPRLFGFVFGENYSLSGFFAQIMVFSFSLNCIASSFSSVFLTFRKIRLNSIWQIFYFIFICFLLLVTDYEIENFLYVYVSIEVVMYGIYCFIIYRLIRQYERSLKNE